MSSENAKKPKIKNLSFILGVDYICLNLFELFRYVDYLYFLPINGFDLLEIPVIFPVVEQKIAYNDQFWPKFYNLTIFTNYHAYLLSPKAKLDLILIKGQWQKLEKTYESPCFDY